MLKCWARVPDERPAFAELVDILSSSLDSKAGYLNVAAFSEHQCSKPEHEVPVQSNQELSTAFSVGAHQMRSSPRKSLQNLYTDNLVL